MSDLFSRGPITDENNFIVVGQVTSGDLLLVPSNIVFNYTWIDVNNTLAISFKEESDPVVLSFDIVDGGKIKIKRASDSVYLALNSGKLVFSNLVSAYEFDITPIKNLLLLPNLYSGAWYNFSYPNLNFEVPNSDQDLVGEGTNGYFSNTPNVKNFFFNKNYPIAFLPTPYRDIDDNLAENIYPLFVSWIENPSSYYHPDVAEWISGNYINIATEPFIPPMLWYNYCDMGYSCGNCFGQVIYGGVECNLNTQVTQPTTPGFFNGLPFLATGPQGEKGNPGIQGEAGPQGATGAPGPQGFRGDSIKGTNDTISWYQGPALAFFGILLLTLVIVLYSILKK